MKTTFCRNTLLLVCLLFIGTVSAQNTSIKDYVSIEITPDHDNWTYQTGEKATFTVRVVRNNITLKNVPLSYELGLEKMPSTKTGTSKMEKGTLTIEAGTLKSPGFMTLQCKTKVDGTSYSNFLNIGFDPEKIEATTTLPKDFTDFWEKAKKDAAGISMNPRLTLMPEKCTSTTNVYHLQLQHYRNGSYFYGILCVPKAAGKYPAVLRVPGAGVHKIGPEMTFAEKGMITLAVGIHGIPLDMDNLAYASLGAGALIGYPTIHLDNKDSYYYRRVYTGCVRALDFLCSMTEYDGENLGVIGGSQGGALAIITTALDPRVKALVSFYPALCDLTGYLNNRAGGWPHLFAAANQKLNNKPEKIETSKYYDVANFARFVKVPGFYSWGYNDPVCPPTSFYSAYNLITAPKEVYVSQFCGHWTTNEQNQQANNWLVNQLIK